ncbi:fatty acid-binding protein DegV [Mycoplasmopsis pullorum]|uniref:DegV family protein n=2 Tax=Mycoplasmopsis pullorum TaxID=48003 RepID=UPI001117B9E6|nr:DegV family protein [Mycoplasmopsis pullorum]TNK82503.1 fatty acid-binding protein DegV [Mycoplasmopsis pullorum]TNK83953.1 fatty acid-binding protein DegV [Mycoplasmopsis pullorum]TNK85315.1 fatty acid-binding protein DegV [Mycoplasmopsis pullorum]TNK86810.1 fatty acid-binding protein DegV [Mycoplasmopsis pullorum]TNK87897.1 fatty acid-binding protein DegV [Mycoplasmopsis pullorum]
MKKVAIIVDSSSGLTKEQTLELGSFFIPLHIEIDNVIYDDGINLSTQNLFDIFNENSDNAKTSSTKLGEVIDLLNSIKDEYENIVIFPISKFLSGQYQSLKLLESDYPNLRVLESRSIAQFIVYELLKFEEKIKNNVPFETALSEIKLKPDYASISLIPKHNTFLVKGGRLHPAAATIAKLFKIVPIIKFEDGQLLKEGKGRIFNKTVLSKVAEKKELVNSSNSTFVLLHSFSNPADYFLAETAQEIENQFGFKPFVLYLPSVVSIHTGPEAICLCLINEDASKYLNKIESL